MTPADHTRELLADLKRGWADIACRTSGAPGDGDPQNVRAVVVGLLRVKVMLDELLGGAK